MKIATWNVERLKHSKDINNIAQVCEKINADILVLTETDSRLRLDYSFCFSTLTMANIQPDKYKISENRVSIFTNYPCIQKYNVYDEYTAICIELKTEQGNLVVYGSVVGAYGNRHCSFMQDLNSQIADIKKLAQANSNICFCGDFNCSFGDNYYYTKAGRNAFRKLFQENKILLLTEKQEECIDHIAVSADFIGAAPIEIEEWNLEKKCLIIKALLYNFTKKVEKMRKKHLTKE